MNDINNNCISYEVKPFEYFIPSPIIFSPFCVSHDKTELFIVSMLRLALYIIIYYLVDENIDLEKHKILKYIMLTNIGINILYVGIVVSKKSLYSIGANTTHAQHQMDSEDNDFRNLF